MADAAGNRGHAQAWSGIGGLIAWALVGLGPWLAHIALEPHLASDQAMFVALALAAVLMWIFRLTPDFVPGLVLILLVTLLDLVPRAVAFSGFQSQVFFLVFGIFVLAALLAETSWINRLEAVLVRRHASFLARVGAVVAAGALLTLVVPSPLGRASMVQPLIHRFLNPTRMGHNALLAAAHVHATTLLSTIILTGNPLNFVLIGLLSEQARDRFEWLGWLVATSVAGLVCVAGFAVAMLVAAAALRRSEPASADDAATAPPGPAPRRDPVRDWATLGLYALLLAAILTRGVHQIPLEWIVLSLAMAVFFFSGLSLDTLRARVDWPTLIFVATVVAWGPMLDHLGLAQLVADRLPGLVPVFDRSVYLGLALTMAGTIAVRLVVPGAPAFILIASALLPLAGQIGISPWVLGFAVLTVSEGFVWPYQHGVLSQTTTMLDGDSIGYRMPALIALNLFHLALRCAAVFASIPLWQALNLM